MGLTETRCEAANCSGNVRGSCLLMDMACKYRGNTTDKMISTCGICIHDPHFSLSCDFCIAGSRFKAARDNVKLAALDKVE